MEGRGKRRLVTTPALLVTTPALLVTTAALLVTTPVASAPPLLNQEGSSLRTPLLR